MTTERDLPSPGLFLCARLRDRRIQLASAKGDDPNDNLVEFRTADGTVLLDACVAAAVSPLLRQVVYIKPAGNSNFKSLFLPF